MYICRHMPTQRTTILLDADLLERLDRHVRSAADDEDRGHRRGRGGVARRARGDARVPVRGHRAQRARAPRRSTGGPSRGARRGGGGGGSLMAILVDPSAIVAAADTADLNHRAAVAWFAARGRAAAARRARARRSWTSCSSASWARVRRSRSLQALVADAIRLVRRPARTSPGRSVLMREAGRASAAARRRAARGDGGAPGGPPGRRLRPAAARGVPAAPRAGAGVRALRNRERAGGPAPFGVLGEVAGSGGGALDHDGVGLDIVEALALGALGRRVQEVAARIRRATGEQQAH